MKQTAVDWLEEFLKQYDCAYSSLDYYELKIPMHIFDKKIGQAKEMEKKQHKQTWFDSTAQFDNAAAMTYKKDFEQYYNETFNQRRREEL
jgi:hypothetical protein